MAAFLIVIPGYVCGLPKRKLLIFHSHGSLGLSSVSGMFKLFVICVVKIITSIKILVVCIYVKLFSVSFRVRNWRTYIDCDNVRKLSLSEYHLFRSLKQNLEGRKFRDYGSVVVTGCPVSEDMDLYEQDREKSPSHDVINASIL